MPFKNFFLINIMNYESIIEISASDNNKIIPIIKTKNDISKIRFSPKIVEYVLREGYYPQDIADIQEVENGYKFILSGGTITSKKDIDYCLENNIKIMFSPHLDEELVKYCFEHGTIIIPGVFTATEIMKAYNMGVKIVKFFPYNFISTNSLKSFLNVFNKLDIKFIVTGGVNKENYKEILQIKNVIFVGSSSIFEI